MEQESGPDELRGTAEILAAVIEEEKKDVKRDYAKVTDEQRVALINRVNKIGENIKDAAQTLNINYENARAIWRAYRMEGQVKKLKRFEKKT